MKVIYDAGTDTLDLIFRDAKISESDEVREGIVVDYDCDGKMVSIEVMNASEHVNEPETMVYQAKASKVLN